VKVAGAPSLRWLARGEDALPADWRWLAPAEVARVSGFRFPKRRTEYLLRRLVTKHAIAAVTGRSTELAALVGIDVRNAPSGAPYVLLDDAPADLDFSVSDRAGWAVCVLGGPTGPAGPGGAGGRVGCDLELVEQRSPGFVRDFLTGPEQRFVTGQRADAERNLAANLIWSAKESALKVLRTGLRRDTRSVEVTVAAPGADGWGELTVLSVDGGRLAGWWRREGRFLLTVAIATAGPPPVALDDPGILATATPRHSWLDPPLSR